MILRESYYLSLKSFMPLAAYLTSRTLKGSLEKKGPLAENGLVTKSNDKDVTK